MTSAPRPTITVCSACLQASCWHGIFPCDQHKAAGTTEKTLEELESLALEHPDYWELDTARSEAA